MPCSGPDSFYLLKTGWPWTPSVVEDYYNFWSSSTSQVLELQVPTSTSGLGSARDQTQGFVHARQLDSTINSPISTAPGLLSQYSKKPQGALPFLLPFTLHTPHSQGTLRGLHLPVFPGLGCSPEECQDVKIQSSDWKCVRSTLSSPWLPQQTDYLLFTRTRTYLQNAAHLTAIHKPVMMIT